MSDFFDDMVEILEPYIDINTGASGEGNYGRYVEFPDECSISDDTIKHLVEYFGLNIPFGKAISFIDVLKDFCEINSVYMDEILSNLQFDNGIIRFPGLQEIREAIIEILKEYGAPIGETKYEDRGELPEKYEYYQLSESEIYDQYSIAFVNYQNEIQIIKDKLSTNQDNMIKKALLLAAFVYTESFITSKVKSILPDVRNYNNCDAVSISILKKHFDDKLKKVSGRSELYKKYFGDAQSPKKTLPEMPYLKLRNILAHDISLPSVYNEEIEYRYIQNNSSEDVVKERKKIIDIIEELIKFTDELEMNIFN